MNKGDVMVGDLVYYLTRHLKTGKVLVKEVVRIAEVLNYGVTTDLPFIPSLWDDIEPIPLTKDILEANGIRHGGIGSEGFEINIALHCQMRLKYVHELQHALKLMKINKEIRI